MSEELQIAADLYESGHIEQAREKYLALADEGSPAAQAFVGWMFLKGVGTQPDVSEAECWFSASASGGNPQGQYFLGRMKEEAGKDIEALQLYEAASIQGHLGSLYRAGMCYLYGRGGKVDTNKGLQTLQEAASRGHLMAERRIAGFLISGRAGLRGVPRGIVTFLRLLPRAIRTAMLNDPYEDRFSG